MTICQASIGNSSAGWRSAWPAAVTRMSTEPNSATVACTMFSTLSGSTQSHDTALTLAPVTSAMSLAAASRFSARRLVTTTLAP